MSTSCSHGTHWGMWNESGTQCGICIPHWVPLYHGPIGSIFQKLYLTELDIIEAEFYDCKNEVILFFWQIVSKNKRIKKLHTIFVFLVRILNNSAIIFIVCNTIIIIIIVARITCYKISDSSIKCLINS